MKKMLWIGLIAGCITVPQTVYAQWNWWGWGRDHQKKEVQEEIRQEKKELKAIDQDARKELQAETRLQTASLDSQAEKRMKQKVEAFQRRQRQISKELEEGMKAMTAPQRAKALSDYRDQQYQAGVAFSDEMHQENVRALRERLEKNPDLSEERKRAIIADMEEQYRRIAVMREKQHAENAKFFDALDSDETMSAEEKQKAVREHFEARHGAYRELREEAKTERKGIREELKGAKREDLPREAASERT
jgi:hypothetical protein